MKGRYIVLHDNRRLKRCDAPCGAPSRGGVADCQGRPSVKGTMYSHCSTRSYVDEMSRVEKVHQSRLSPATDQTTRSAKNGCGFPSEGILSKNNIHERWLIHNIDVFR